MSDEGWNEHLREMDELRHSVQNASYENKDPLLIYKLESYNLFKTMVDNMNRKTAAILMRGQIPVREEPTAEQRQAMQARQAAVAQQAAQAIAEDSARQRLAVQEAAPEQHEPLAVGRHLADIFGERGAVLLFNHTPGDRAQRAVFAGISGSFGGGAVQPDAGAAGGKRPAPERLCEYRQRLSGTGYGHRLGSNVIAVPEYPYPLGLLAALGNPAGTAVFRGVSAARQRFYPGAAVATGRPAPVRRGAAALAGLPDWRGAADRRGGLRGGCRVSAALPPAAPARTGNKAGCPDCLHSAKERRE